MSRPCSDISILSAIDCKDPQPDQLHWRAVDLWIGNKKNNTDDVFCNLDKINSGARANQDMTSRVNEGRLYQQPADCLRHRHLSVSVSRLLFLGGALWRDRSPASVGSQQHHIHRAVQMV